MLCYKYLFAQIFQSHAKAFFHANQFIFRTSGSHAIASYVAAKDSTYTRTHTRTQFGSILCINISSFLSCRHDLTKFHFLTHSNWQSEKHPNNNYNNNNNNNKAMAEAISIQLTPDPRAHGLQVRRHALASAPAHHSTIFLALRLLNPMQKRCEVKKKKKTLA